jgi:hypothetical protein
MALPTFSTPSNPSIGNDFNSEATVLNTLLTALKTNWTDFNTYLTGTGLEHQYIAPKAIEGANVVAHANLQNLGAGETTVTATNIYTSASTSITTSYADAYVRITVQIAIRNNTVTTGYVTLPKVQRDDNSGFTSPTNILLGSAGDAAERVGANDGSADGEYFTTITFIDATTKPADTYYYRFIFTAGSTDLIVKERASYIEVISYNTKQASA